MINNKNNYSRGSHGFSTRSARSLNKVNSFLKVFVFTLVILAIQCFNESFSASAQKSSGNGPKVAISRLLSDLDDSTESISTADEDEGSKSNITAEYYYIIVDDGENQVDEYGSAENFPLHSKIDDDIQMAEEVLPIRQEKISRGKDYRGNIIGETTVTDIIYEDEFMRNYRNKKRKGKFHKRMYKFLKKHHYIIPTIIAGLSLIVNNTGLAIGVMMIYLIFMSLLYVHKKVI